MIIYTIGFTKKLAKEFFEALQRSGARHLLDIRLHNTSQLAGFTYHEMPLLAPEDSFLSEYRKTGDWAKFEQSYLELIRQRQVERHIDPALFEDGVVLLCGEAEPNHCHRRLAAEYLARSMLAAANIKHL